MIAAMDISITKAERSKLQDLNPDNLPFGRYFTDHMLEADFENGEWKSIEIKPYSAQSICSRSSLWPGNI
jgi:branched-chain amino acid aminotransferase